MVTQELITYIKVSLERGKTREDIEKELFLGGGWSAKDLDDAFIKVQGSGPVAVSPKKAHKKVRLVWVVILMLLAAGAGWWVRDRQQFFKLQATPLSNTIESYIK